jgi:iron complex transport system substrate-binding protein
LRKVTIVLGLVLLFILATGCRQQPATSENTTFTVVDQLGRRVEVPRNLQRIASIEHLGGLTIFALGQQDKQVNQSLYGRFGRAMAATDKKFAALPQLTTGHAAVSPEQLAALGTQVVFVNASYDKSQVAQMENAGIITVAIRGLTLEDSIAAVRLMAKVLQCEDRGEEYIAECEKILALVRERTSDIPAEQRPRVMLTGPKSVFSVAGGEMLATSIIEKAGAQNVAADLKGFWADVSPEQVAAWNPDVIFLGSSLETYSIDQFYNNPHLQTVKAIREKRVYTFPSNIDWWDYPAPHYVLGALWTAKTLHPDKFADVDMIKVADEFYVRFLGHSFTAMGGKL